MLKEDKHSSSGWGDAAVICPWTIYFCFSDERVLEEQYESMKSWVEYIKGQAKNGLIWNTGFHFGDWLGLDKKEDRYFGATPTDLISTAFYAYSTGLLAKTSKVLRKPEDEREYSQLHENIVKAFRGSFSPLLEGLPSRHRQHMYLY
jgi:alpha-L-rhamnosidase